MNNDIDFTRIYDGERLIGVMNFNTMIPVEESLIRVLNVKINPNDSAAEKAYKILCSKELDWIQKNQDAIIRKAKKLYKMIVNGQANHNLKRRCLEFKKLEAVLAKRINKIE